MSGQSKPRSDAQTAGPRKRKATQSSESKIPQTLKIRDPFTGSLNRFEALSPKYVQMNNAATQMDTVTVIMTSIPVIPPPSGVMY